MKIHIHAQLKSGAWGGGNQFLKALKVEFAKEGIYAETAGEANALIFNGYQELGAVFSHWLFHNKQKRIYRLGPITSLHRRGFKWRLIDRLVVMSANLFADLVIFQSKWSHEQAQKLGLWKNKKYAIIINAVDASVFYKKEFREKPAGEKIKLVYTSWSSNMKKGFRHLKLLDENLDFKKYDFMFIGNSPFEFRNIKILKPQGSLELAAKIRESDIFVSPVEDDACSNALLEGLASGLPAVALRSGGNPEVVDVGGEMFSSENELIGKIDKVANNPKSYYDKIAVKSMKEVAEEYLNAILN